MGVKRAIQVQNLEDVQSLLLHLSSCHVSPGMLKSRKVKSLKDSLHSEGEGLEICQTGS